MEIQLSIRFSISCFSSYSLALFLKALRLSDRMSSAERSAWPAEAAEAAEAATTAACCCSRRMYSALVLGGPGGDASPGLVVAGGGDPEGGDSGCLGL